MNSYIKKFIIFLIILVISYLLYIGLYLKGYFNPKEIFIGNIKIDIPNNMHLLSYKTEGKTTLNNPLLPLVKKNYYDFPIEKEISFLFSSFDKSKKPNILTFSVVPSEKIDVSKYKNTKKCFIYNYKNGIYISEIYHKAKKAKIKISSDDNKTFIKTINNFCK